MKIALALLCISLASVSFVKFSSAPLQTWEFVHITKSSTTEAGIGWDSISGTRFPSSGKLSGIFGISWSGFHLTAKSLADDSELYSNEEEAVVALSELFQKVTGSEVTNQKQLDFAKGNLLFLTEALINSLLEDGWEPVSFTEGFHKQTKFGSNESTRTFVFRRMQGNED